MSILDKFNIVGRSALVTGAGSGIGLAYAEAMAEAGAKVTLTDVDGEGAEREAARLRASGHEARADQLDVSDRAATERVFDAHVAAFGGLDIVFANAGVGIGPGFWSPDGTRSPDGQVDTYDADLWDRSIAINLTGVYNTMRDAARLMKAGGKGGSIIATASNAGLIIDAIVPHALYARQGRGAAHGARAGARTGRISHQGECDRAGAVRHQYRRRLGQERPDGAQGLRRIDPAGQHRRNLPDQAARAATRLRRVELHDRQPCADRRRRGAGRTAVRAVSVQGLHQPLIFETLPDPTPGAGEVVVKIGRCGICGSDLHMTEDPVFGVGPGDVLGHEFAGEVVALGKGAEGLVLGDLVSVIPLKSCGNCELAARASWRGAPISACRAAAMPNMP